jgi:hypothetical protein
MAESRSDMMARFSKLAGWRKLAAASRQLYPLSCNGLDEVGGLAAENRVGPCPGHPIREVVPQDRIVGAA